MIYGEPTFGGLSFQTVMPMCPQGGSPPQLPDRPDTSWALFTQTQGLAQIRQRAQRRLVRGHAYPPLRRNPRHSLLGLGAARAEASAITAINNALTTVHSGVNEVGADVWNGLAADISKAGRMPDGVPYFTGLDWVNDEIIKRVNDVMPSPSYWPTTDAVNFAQQRVREFQAMLNYAKAAAPAVAQKVEARQAVVAEMVRKMTPYKDPNVVGWETFKSEALKRAEELASGIGSGFGIGTALAIGAGVLAVLFFALGKRGGR